MTKEEHAFLHQQLHSSLDELVANFIYHTGKLPSKTTIFELILWSTKQCDPETADFIQKEGNLHE